MNRCAMCRCGKRPSGITNNSNKPSASIIATAAMTDTFCSFRESDLDWDNEKLVCVVSCAVLIAPSLTPFLFTHFLLVFAEQPLFFSLFYSFYSFSLSFFLSLSPPFFECLWWSKSSGEGNNNGSVTREHEISTRERDRKNVVLSKLEHLLVFFLVVCRFLFLCLRSLEWWRDSLMDLWSLMGRAI